MMTCHLTLKVVLLFGDKSCQWYGRFSFHATNSIPTSLLCSSFYSSVCLPYSDFLLWLDLMSRSVCLFGRQSFGSWSSLSGDIVYLTQRCDPPVISLQPSDTRNQLPQSVLSAWSTTLEWTQGLWKTFCHQIMQSWSVRVRDVQVVQISSEIWRLVLYRQQQNNTTIQPCSFSFNILEYIILKLVFMVNIVRWFFQWDKCRPVAPSQLHITSNRVTVQHIQFLHH